MEAVIACWQFSVRRACVLDTRRCMPRSAERWVRGACTLLVSESTSVCRATEKGAGKVGQPLGVVCYSPALHTSLQTEEGKRMPRRGSWRTRGCVCVRLLAGCVHDGYGIS
jgi:hypothetical protein